MENDAGTRLEGERLKGYFSTYLMGGGLSEDVPEIEEVLIKGNFATATCRLKSYFVSPSDLEFHLSAVIGMVLLVQTGIAHAYADAGFDRKPSDGGEVFLSEYNVRYLDQVRNASGITLSLERINRVHVPPIGRRKRPRTVNRWNLRVTEGGTTNASWNGNMALVFPF
jgi:hypothetical protein